MNVLCRYFTAMRLTFLLASICFGGLCLASNSKDTPGKPTNLRVTSVHNLTITLTWTKPLTTVGTPLSTSLLYRVSYVVQGSGNRQNKLDASTESAQFDLLFNKKYNIHVKAIRGDDQRIQGEWSDNLQVNSNDFVPATPTNLRVTRASGLNVFLAWEESRTTVKGIPDTSNLKYKISFRRLPSGKTRQVESDSESTKLSLVANSKYDIKVRAYKTFNARVLGPWSGKLPLKTNESSPTEPPTNVKVVSNTPSSITVSWDPVPENGRNGIIQGYVVFYKRDELGVKVSERDVKLAYSQELRNLTTGKRYSVSVAGYTRVGTGTKSGRKTIIVGGQFITTTKQTSTQKLTTVKSPSTTKQTTNLSTKSSTLAITTIALSSVSTKEQPKTTGAAFSQDPYKRSSTDSESTTKTLTGTENTPAVALASKADEKSDSGFLDKILMIGAPAAGALLLMLILMAIFVSARRRSRKRRQQNGEIPLQHIESRQNRSRDGITRGASSVRYGPPQYALAEDSMTERLLTDETDLVTVVVNEPNGSLPRAVAANAPLLPADYPEKCGLSVDLNTEQRKLAEGHTSGFYDSIKSLDRSGCKETAKRDTGERYVTRDQMAAVRDKCPLDQMSASRDRCQLVLDQMAASRDKCPLVLLDQTPYQQNSQFERSNGVKTNGSTQGIIYENIQDSEHLYETLGSEEKEDPLYENTKTLANSRESNRDKEEGYEPIPFI